MSLTDPLLHYLNRICEKENVIKFCYVLNYRCLAMIIYDDRTIYKSRIVWRYDTSTGRYSSAGKHLQNDLAKKSGKAHVMPVLPVVHHCLKELLDKKALWIFSPTG